MKIRFWGNENIWYIPRNTYFAVRVIIQKETEYNPTTFWLDEPIFHDVSFDQLFTEERAKEILLSLYEQSDAFEYPSEYKMNLTNWRIENINWQNKFIFANNVNSHPYSLANYMHKKHLVDWFNIRDLEGTIHHDIS